MTYQFLMPIKPKFRDEYGHFPTISLSSIRFGHFYRLIYGPICHLICFDFGSFKYGWKVDDMLKMIYNSMQYLHYIKLQ